MEGLQANLIINLTPLQLHAICRVDNVVPKRGDDGRSMSRKLLSPTPTSDSVRTEGGDVEVSGGEGIGVSGG